MKKFSWLIPVIILLIVFYFTSGYRFTAMSAAESHPSLLNDSELIDRYEEDAFTIFTFKSDENQMYQTVLAEKKSILYKSEVSTYYPYNNDPIQLIGGLNVDAEDFEISFLSITSHDDEVAYIEAGKEPDKLRKEANVNEFITFAFSSMVQVTDLQPTAFNEQGEALYYFGYPKGENHLKTEDYKWHRFEDGQSE